MLVTVALGQSSRRVMRLGSPVAHGGAAEGDPAAAVYADVV